jgi:arsenite methyltransferase
MPSLFDGPVGALAAKVMARANRAAEAEAIEQLGPAPSDTVLVIGFGPGVGVALLAARLADGAVVGVDPSAVMLRTASRANRANIRAGKVSLHQASAAATPSPAAVFDGVIAVNTLQLCEPLEETARELARVMKPGAHLVSMTHDWALQRHGGSVDRWIERARATLQSRGFDDIRDYRGQAENGKIVGLSARRS